MRLQVTEAVAGFTPVDLAALRADAEARFDVYIQERSQLVLYHSSTYEAQPDLGARLDRGDVRTVYVPDAQRVLLSRYLEEHVESILSDDGVSTAAKARTALTTAEAVARDVMGNPTPENLGRSVRVVHALARFSATNPLAIGQLVRGTRAHEGLHVHSANTAVYALAMAHRGGERPLDRVADLAVAAYLHDVGLSAIPSEVLSKQGPLNDDERDLVRKHPVIGEQLVLSADDVTDNVARAIRLHHERLDGQGYPDRLTTAEIPWEARLTMVAEVFDALTSDQPYRPAMRSFRAIHLMLAGGAGALDRDTVRTLIPTLSGEVPASVAEQVN